MVHRKYFKKSNLFVYPGVIIVVTLVLLLSSVWAEDEVGIDFVVPAPENSEKIDTFTLKLRGQDVSGVVYKSEDNRFDVANYYSDFFRDEEFDNVLDEKMPDMVPPESIAKPENASLLKGGNIKDKVMELLPRSKIRRMQFKKDQLVVEVALTAADDGTDVGIAKYLLPIGVANLDELPMSTEDTFFDMPKEDLEGEDLSDVPRPPDSVRLSNMNIGKQTYVTYTTELSLDEALEFYERMMELEGWDLTSSFKAGDMLDKYKKMSGSKKGFKLGKLRFPFSGSRDLDKAFYQTYTLNFTNDYEFVKITIMPNIISSEEGAVVQIVYSEEGDMFGL